MENNEFADLDDFFNQEPEPNNSFNYLDLFEYVVKKQEIQNGTYRVFCY